MKPRPRVIVGIGEVEAGVRPLAWALAEARRRDAELHAVRAWRDGNRAGPLTDSWRQHLESDARKVLSSAFGLAIGGVVPDFSCRLLVREGIAADVLLRYADREDDLLVLGTARHGAWWPFGQRTVPRCVGKAGCAVAVVPPTALARSMPVRRLLRELRRDLRDLERMSV